jgi:hypothetical protein
MAIIVHTKYLSPTNYKGARIKAFTIGNAASPRRSTTVGYDHALSADSNHIRAALEFAARLLQEDDLIPRSWMVERDGNGQFVCIVTGKPGRDWVYSAEDSGDLGEYQAGYQAGWDAHEAARAAREDGFFAQEATT